MTKYLTVLFLLFIGISAIAQIDRGGFPTLDNKFVEDVDDTTRINTKEIKIKLSGKTFFKDYKIIDFKNDTTFIDTTLNIKKDYSFNYIRKDNLELIAFANQGQTFNNLAYTFSNNTLIPKIGARAQHFNFYEVEDVKYFYVPTPTTQLMYRSGMEQGQVFDGFFTFNTSEQLNASIAFKGMRSLGIYRNTLSDHGNARVTLNYHTKNNRYNIRTHLVAQDLNNDQNGGLTDESIEDFESADPNFKDRNRLITNFTDAKTTLRGNRYYFEHNYKIWNKNDSLKKIPSGLIVGHIFNYERKNYEYRQETANPIFGDAFTSDINDKLKYSKLFNEVYLSLNSPITLGEVKFKVNNFNYDYRYNSILISDDGFIDSNLNGNIIAVGGEWNTKFKKINFNIDASTNVSGNLKGHNISAKASFVKDSLVRFQAGVFRNSKAPNFNFLLNQSAYKAFNWQNNFKNEDMNGVNFEIDAQKWIYASIEITNINNYTYFDAPNLGEQTKPVQTSETVNYLKLKLSKEIKFGHFALDNQFIYQNVSAGTNVLNVPDFITRNTFYYANHIFKGKPLFIQTGVTFSYFSKYYMNTYNPVISEFYLQNDQKYGGFPLLDFFVNIRVRTMRVYFKLEHFNSSFGENNYYSAPTYPYRDFTVRFGLIWNFFI